MIWNNFFLKTIFILFMIFCFTIFYFTYGQANGFTDSDFLSIGYQYTFPHLGFSVLYDLNSKESLQAIMTANNFSFRGIYRVLNYEQDWNLYGFSGIGLLKLTCFEEKMYSFNLGIGLEFFPVIFKNSEQLAIRIKPNIEFSFSISKAILDTYAFSIGTGIHYLF